MSTTSPNPGPSEVATTPDRMPGAPSALTCPECGGVIWEDSEGDLVRFRCHVGHSFSAESMLVLHSDAVETAMWTALRILEERMHFLRGLAERQRSRGSEHSARNFERRATEVGDRAGILRRAIAVGEAVPDQGEVAS